MKKLFISTAIISVFMIAISQQISAQGIVYHGCVKIRSGILRIVENPGECTTRETPISWNQTGPQGEPGPQGEQGPPGPEGSAGQGCINVKSADGEFIGILVDFKNQTNQPEDPNITAYIPSLGKFI